LPEIVESERSKAQAMSIFIASSFLLLICGIITLIVTANWKPQPGKGIFLLFIVLAMILPPALWILAMLIASGGRGYGSGYYQSARTLQALLPVITFASLFLSGFLLVWFSIARAMDQSMHLAIKDSQKLSKQKNWRTTSSQTDLIQTMRRREWAFLIDHTPLFLAWVLFAVAAGSETMSRILGPLLALVWAALHIGFIIYLPCKDAAGGISLGKYFTGCRTVDFRTGRPIDLSQSMARNLFLLIPGMALVELVVASCRSDRRRLGDLMASTIVVLEKPADATTAIESSSEKSAMRPHPLDD
jgi:uncharacterized RDD family membrane protein YckC